MDKPTTSSRADVHSCIICEKLGSSYENNSDLGDIIKISRGVTRKFGSKKVINKCHSLGLFASYKEATLYEASTTCATTPPEIKPSSFAQFGHDNADFNISTIDGEGTFHYIGSIEIITPADSIQPRQPIKRLKTST
ncbi:hypothetical protein TNCV_3407321 [Trichonephila clavipes]|nr:hypothetical protein TNCV_3407321 [Trichonephila clavipes]